MNARTLALGLAAVLAVAGAAAPAAAASAYRVTVVPAPGDASPFALNARGHVVGYASFGGGVTRPFLWRGGRQVLDLGSFGGPFGVARGINRHDAVVGFGEDASGRTLPFVWRRGRLHRLATLAGGGDTFATAVNDHGLIVGDGVTAAGEDHALLWRRGVVHDLGTLGGPVSTAQAVNERGQAAGWSRVSDVCCETHAVLWSGGRIHDLGTLGTGDTFASDLNDAGDVVGSFDVRQTFRAFLWHDGSMRNLRWGDASAAYAINDAGVVVGSGRGGALVYRRGHTAKLSRLVPRGWQLFIAQDVNERGQIVASGVDPAGRVRHTLLLTPVSAARQLRALARSARRMPGPSARARALPEISTALAAAEGGHSARSCAALGRLGAELPGHRAARRLLARRLFALRFTLGCRD